MERQIAQKGYTFIFYNRKKTKINVKTKKECKFVLTFIDFLKKHSYTDSHGEKRVGEGGFMPVCLFIKRNFKNIEIETIEGGDSLTFENITHYRKILHKVYTNKDLILEPLLDWYCNSQELKCTIPYFELVYSRCDAFIKEIEIPEEL